MEFLQGSKSQTDISVIEPVNPKRLPNKLDGMQWPPVE